MKVIKFKKQTSWLQNIGHFLYQTLLEPACTLKKWTVNSGGWLGGHFKSFWRLENAIAYAKEQRGLFIDIENEITGEEIRVRNNPGKIKPPVRYVQI